MSNITEMYPSAPVNADDELDMTNPAVLEWLNTVDDQPVVEAATYEDLPDVIFRKCCCHENCGGINYVKGRRYMGLVDYKIYDGSESLMWGTVEDAVAVLNDTKWSPSRYDVLADAGLVD